MADQTTLTVESEEITPGALRQSLEQSPNHWYVILDACDAPLVPVKVRELGDRAVSLYRGAAERDLWAIAPYLARLDAELLDWIVENLWEEPWGIIISAATDLAGLRKHLRRFLMVEDPDGEQMYFRYYDPQVLPTVLETFAAEESKAFFGPMESIDIPRTDAAFVRYSRRSRNQ